MRVETSDGAGCSYQMGGQDWSLLFDSYDKDGSGGLDVQEFIATVRNDAGISESQFSDNEIANLFYSIDVDRSGVIDAAEFESWLKTPIRRKTGSPRESPSPGASDDQDAEDDAAKDVAVGLNAGVPFIAEYIVVRKVPMWDYPDADRHDNRRIGTLQKGEVVAVTQVWHKYRLWVHRLGWNKVPSSGWVSSRANNGRGEVLLERLPVEEWSSRFEHETAVAQRVATLQKAQTLYDKTARARPDTGESVKPNIMSQDWVDKQFNTAEPGKRAARLLRDIPDPERCKELLAGMLWHSSVVR